MDGTAVVTGASSGIGEAIARHPVDGGHIVNISSRAAIGNSGLTVYSVAQAGQPLDSDRPGTVGGTKNGGRLSPVGAPAAVQHRCGTEYRPKSALEV